MKLFRVDSFFKLWSNKVVKSKQKNMNVKISIIVGMIIIIAIAALSNFIIWQKINEEKAICVDSFKTALESRNIVPDIEKQIPSESVCELGTDSDISLPVVRFIPGTFSDNEKQELMEMVVNPFIDFENDSYAQNRIISIAVEKYGDSELAEMQNPKYMYNINAIYEEGYGGWLERKVGEPIDWWVPDCLDECQFSEEFSAKYPEIIEKYNKIQNPEE